MPTILKIGMHIGTFKLSWQEPNIGVFTRAHVLREYHKPILAL